MFGTQGGVFGNQQGLLGSNQQLGTPFDSGSNRGGLGAFGITQQQQQPQQQQQQQQLGGGGFQNAFPSMFGNQSNNFGENLTGNGALGINSNPYGLTSGSQAAQAPGNAGNTFGLQAFGGQALMDSSTGQRGPTIGSQQPQQQQLPHADIRSSPFGLGFNSQPAATQLELFKQQLMAQGVDPTSLPEILRLLLPRIANPNLRTFQLVVHVVGRMNDLVNRTKDPELLSFGFSKAPSADVAGRMQALCDQQTQLCGPTAVQKLTRTKKMSPEPRSHYYTVALVGFDGLQRRVKEQSEFFQHFASSLSELQARQRKSHEEFQSKALARLEAIRERQVHLTHRIIGLIGSLDELAIRAQNFEADDTEISQVEQEYDKLIGLTSCIQNSLASQIPAIRERLRTALSGLATPQAVPPEEEKSAEKGPNVSPLRTGPKQTAIRDLVMMAENHHEEIERIKQQIQVLKASISI